MAKKHSGHAEDISELAKEVLDILLTANTTDSTKSRRKADSQLEELASSKAKFPVAIAGSLASKSKADQFVDVHIPLANGATLTVSLSGKETVPPILPLTIKQVALSDGPDAGAGTIEYYMTKTVNSGLPDEQGDSRPD